MEFGFYSSVDDFPVMLIAEDIPERWLGVCWCADTDTGLAPLVEVLPRPTSWQTKGFARPGRGPILVSELHELVTYLLT